MNENIKHHRGHFIWHELFSPDLEASKKFYGGLFGWNFATTPMPSGEGSYTTISVGDRPVAGLMDLAMIQGEGAPPHWMPYVSIANIDESAAAAKANGGSVAVEPMSIEGIGRMTVIGDPQNGHSSCIDFTPGDPDQVERPGPGMFCWDQLNSSDPASAASFYGKVYGWQQKEFPHGGDMSVFHAGEWPVASMMQAPAGVPSHWLCYIVVEELTRGNELVEELGGEVMIPKIEIPEVGTASVVRDNVGAGLCLFEPPKVD